VEGLIPGTDPQVLDVPTHKSIVLAALRSSCGVEMVRAASRAGYSRAYAVLNRSLVGLSPQSISLCRTMPDG
jgi:hypothetical protein